MINGIFALCTFQSIMVIIIFICVIGMDDVRFLDHKLSNFLITTNNKLQFLTECIIEMKQEECDMEAVCMLKLNEWKYNNGAYYTMPLLLNVNEISSITDLAGYINGSEIVMCNGNKFSVKESTEYITDMIF